MPALSVACAIAFNKGDMATVRATLKDLDKVEKRHPLSTCVHCEAALAQGDLEKAQQLAAGALSHLASLNQSASDPFHSTMKAYAQFTLGRVALGQGDLPTAVHRLMAAQHQSHHSVVTAANIHLASPTTRW
ncbi:hypothetical protein KIPB_001451 [Kipferlia bialata]|uniref:Uncharacterized protein n=1 Tax=Kipferlia bialata TaxID=797122 RepID=A0A9K3GF71_9EUKA|nr:hypothetical protein KIPB_001451 [Kipferlia bialata]|eukprot:g1451.t1